jgi:outer membrane protein assembly factor BamB
MADANPQLPQAAPSPVTESAAPPRLPEASMPKLRLWPGVVIVALQWLLLLVPSVFNFLQGQFDSLPDWMDLKPLALFGILIWTPIGTILAVTIWWLFASRLRWADRGLILFACAAAGVAMWLFRDPTIGLMAVIFYALPVVTTAWVGWLLITPFLRWRFRRLGLLVMFLLGWGYFDLVRFEGVWGGFSAEFAYRWQPTAEQQYLAEAVPTSIPVPTATLVTLGPGDWPGFRGPNRDNRLTGVRIATDWKAHPPKLLWRHRVGPGWSSFAVVGSRAYTQEQHGPEELVVCYEVITGERLWVHTDDARFSEDIGGPGPRATPTFHEGRIYTQGAAGRLNCLDAATGQVIWSRDIVADSGAKVPTWGYAASPLVAEGIVTVFAGAPDGKSVLGYHAASGELAWSAGEGQYSYCSTQRARLGGVEQLLFASDTGVTAFHPTDGKVLWKYDWPLEDTMARIVQPALLSETDLLIGSPFGKGTRRVRVKREADRWSDQKIWESLAINPYFNDFVIQGNHLYGFEGTFFTCISLEDGKRRWKERGYGTGQVLLLADQNLLLVLSEKGEVALVEANPERRKEVARLQAITGKTWNHPVLAHGKLLVRNGEEAACFQVESGN